jgi:NADH-quinone oxidoreductase subunit G
MALPACTRPCADARRAAAAQDLANRLGSGATQVDSGCPELDADVRSTYVANTTVSGIEAADAILLIGTNPRVEAPVFNARCARTRPLGRAPAAASALRSGAPPGQRQRREPVPGRRCTAPGLHG